MLLIMATSLFFLGCDQGQSDPAEETIFSEVTLLFSMTPEEINAIGFPVTASAPINFYRVTYNSVNSDGSPVVVSGAMALPQNPISQLPLVSYQHATLVRRQETASFAGMNNFEAAIAVLYASTGHAAIMPDYLGMGVDDTQLHPYVHASTLASASRDMILGMFQWALSEGIPLNGEVLLNGYSEGGYATLALQRLLQNENPEVNVVASAPMAGPYHVSRLTQQQLLADQETERAYMVPYLILAYNQEYNFSSDLSTFFKAPYASTIPGLYDGMTRAEDINAALPSRPSEMLTASFISEVTGTSGTSAIRSALEANNLHEGWAPSAPTKFFHCATDELVNVENAQSAYDNFNAAGSPVEIRIFPSGDHVSCAGGAIVEAKYWFDTKLGKSGSSPIDQAAWVAFFDELQGDLTTMQGK